MRRAFLFLFSVLATACGAPPDVVVEGEGERASDDSSNVGVLIAPLRHAVGTSEFVLHGADLTLRGPIEGTLSAAIGAEALAVELPAGTYEVSLGASSNVQLDTPAGAFHVEAFLVSANPNSIEIEPGLNANVEWWFSVTSHVLAFGDTERAPGEPANGRHPCSPSACDGATGHDFDECLAKCEFAGGEPACQVQSDCGSGETCCLHHPKQGASWLECRTACPTLFAGETLRARVCTQDSDCASDRRCVRAAAELVSGGGLCL